MGISSHREASLWSHQAQYSFLLPPDLYRSFIQHRNLDYDCDSCRLDNRFLLGERL